MSLVNQFDKNAPEPFRDHSAVETDLPAKAHNLSALRSLSSRLDSSSKMVYKFLQAGYICTRNKVFGAAGAAEVETQKTDVSSTITAHEIGSLPTVNHNVTRLYLDVPGRPL